MKKRDLANVALSALSMPAVIASVAGVVLTVSSDQAQAQSVTCAQGTPTGAIICTGTATSGTFYARDLAFTGSVNVVMFAADDATGFGACAGHRQGSGNNYGLTTLGGSVEIVTGVAGSIPSAANLTGGGCN